jgi:alcohol dehydrogenase class IV
VTLDAPKLPDAEDDHEARFAPVGLDALERASMPAGARTVSFDGQRVAFDLAGLASLVADAGITRPMLLVDRRAVDAAGLGSALAEQLPRHDRVFDAIEPNPTARLAHAAIDAARRAGADGLVAVGGGSCIDLAKATAIGLEQRSDVDATFAGALGIHGAAPLVAVPTTAGSGSQATSFGVLYVEGRKRSLDHPSLRPRAVVLDRRFIEALPGRLSAISGLDALCQCVESIWACGATDRSRALAAAGGGLLSEHLRAAAGDHEPGACRAIMLGAHLSGCAINISRTTAAHAYSYAITLRHGVPHGLAVALSLGWVAAWNAGVDEASCQHPLGAASARALVTRAAAILGVDPAGVGCAMAALLDTLGLPASLSAAGVPERDLPVLAASMDPLRLGNNPRALTRDDVLACTAGLPARPSDAG